MKWLLAAVNAKYIHSNPGVYSLKLYAEHTEARQGAADVQGDLAPEGAGLPSVRVEIGEYTINHQMDQILEDIYRRKPDIVGFSCYIWNIAPVLELVRDLHKILPDTDIWLGGPEVSFDAPELLAREPEVLGVMKGEGEETFAQLVGCYRELGMTVRAGSRQQGRDEGGGTTGMARMTGTAETTETVEIPQNLASFFARLSHLSGLAWRQPDRTICDRPVRPVMDMSRIPFLYPETEGFENRILYYESSRGCPFSCSYCLSSIDKTVRFRDLELVERELDVFLERRVPQVKFVDRTFNCKKSHAMAIWKHILEHDNGMTNFHFEIAADLLDEEELELLGRMRPGLVQLEIGVQSTNPQTIREIRRVMDLDKVRAAVARVNRGHNVHQHLDLIAGLPYEDLASFARSFNDVYAMEPEQLQLGFLKVLKGSLMYEKAEEYGLAYRQTPPYEVLSTRWLSYGDVLLLKGVEQMVEVYYNSRQFSTVLKLLEAEFSDPFTMFCRMAEYYRERGLDGLSHSRLARYEILHGWIGELLAGGGGGKEPSAVRSMSPWEDALMQDLYLRENAKSRPAFAPDQSRYKDRIRELAPELRTLGSQVHAEVLQSGQILLFDYRRRDPLSRNAAVRVLGTVGAGPEPVQEDQA